MTGADQRPCLLSLHIAQGIRRAGGDEKDRRRFDQRILDVQTDAVGEGRAIRVVAETLERNQRDGRFLGQWKIEPVDLRG